MPSGSKKRKAAKKKKETEANSAPHSHQGGEDRKRHEENDSDGGETNSPLSQDHHHNIQQFAEVKDKSEEDTSAIQSAVIENESVEGVNGYGNSSNKVAVDEKSDIQIDREMKLKDGSEPNEVTFDYVEFETKSNSSSSSSSSDDESKFVDKKIVVINWGEPIEYAPSLRVEAAAVSDLRKTSDLPEVTQVNEVVLHNLAVVPPKDESYEVVSAEGPSGISVEPADLPKITPVTETFPVVVDHETIPLVEPVVLSKEEVHLDEDLGLKVDYKSESLGVSSSTIDTGLQSKVDIISTTATEDSEVISVAILQEDERKTLPQSSVPVVETVNSADHKKDTEIESLDKKTPVALTSRSMQATSCVGCCGLFELFTGSNR